MHDIAFPPEMKGNYPFEKKGSILWTRLLLGEAIDVVEAAVPA